MILRPTEIPPQRSTGKAIAGSATGRGELLVAFSDLLANVEKLAIQVNRIVTQADAANVTFGGKEPDRLEALVRTDLARDLQAGGTADATHFPLSPHQDSWKGDAQSGDGDEVNLSIKVAEFDRKRAGSRARHAIAGRVLDLHDRLGGFIKPLPPRAIDEER